MTIVLIGASGSGKSVIETALTYHGYEKIVSHTTREPRKYEISGNDYYFTSISTFKRMIDIGLFAEYDEYSQGRMYGTLKSDYNEGDKVVVLTPNGLRQLKKKCQVENIFTVLVEANLGTRMKRYIDRCGVEKFNYDDKNEISARVERDYGMFLGLENEVDLVINNNEGEDITNIVNVILNKLNERKENK